MNINPDNILNIACKFYDSAILFAALELDIFTTISGSDGMTVDEIASVKELDSRCCRLLLDGCVATGLLEKECDRYKNTSDSATFLVSGQPSDLSGAIKYNYDVYPAWGKLSDLVRTGSPVEPPELHLGDDAERTRRFVVSMDRRCRAIGQAVVPMLNLDGCTRLLDIGGGPGAYSSLIAERNPGIHCTVMDLPPVVSIASDLVAENGMTDHVSFIGGDYHTTQFPKNVDVVLFFGVLHQESPDSIRSLFSRAYESLQPGGAVYVLDMMTDETRCNPPFSAMFAVNMALTTDNGWVFSDGELETWLRENGFTDMELSTLPPPMPHWLMSARKPI